MGTFKLTAKMAKRLSPITKTDEHGRLWLIGYARKPESRKAGRGDIMLQTHKPCKIVGTKLFILPRPENIPLSHEEIAAVLATVGWHSQNAGTLTSPYDGKEYDHDTAFKIHEARMHEENESSKSESEVLKMEAMLEEHKWTRTKNPGEWHDPRTGNKFKTEAAFALLDQREDVAAKMRGSVTFISAPRESNP